MAASPFPKTLQALIDDRRVRYVLTGGGSAAVSYLIFSVTWLLASQWLHYLVVAVWTNLATAVVMYPVYRRLVFKATGPWLAGFFRFYTVFISGLVAGLVGLPLLIEVVGVPVLLAQMIMTVAVPLISYQVYRLWAFRHRPHETADGDVNP